MILVSREPTRAKAVRFDQIYELIVDCDRHLTIVDCVLTIGSS